MVNSYFPPNIINELEKISFFDGEEKIELDEGGEALFNLWKKIIKNSEKLYDIIIEKSGGNTELENVKDVFETYHYFLEKVHIKER